MNFSFFFVIHALSDQIPHYLGIKNFRNYAISKIIIVSVLSTTQNSSRNGILPK